MDRPWGLMRGAARAADAPRSVRPGTVGRIWRFARPHRRRLLAFLLLTVVGAGIGVATPVLAGRVVNAIVAGGQVSAAAATVVGLAGGIAALAVLEAVTGLVSRWFSSRIGEDLIVDLRTAVYAHVQRMPVAFFTRTRTGALVSRLNNDVIGAQSAITSTLASVLSNVIQLTLALAVMISLAWQVTLLALVLLPIFVLPARRMGRRIADLRRESADLNAQMSSQMTERFSAPGATLVKLFGRPEEEAREFGERAERVRDIGVRTAMVSRVFVTALSLVSALAQALVYGLGGYLAVTGAIAPGTVVTLALLLTRLYTPMTALANARVDVMTALVSFERVFEVLDLQPLITERPDPLPLPPGPVSVRLRDVHFAYPGAERVSLASLEDVAVLDRRVNADVLHGVDLAVGRRPPAGAGRAVGRGQVDDRRAGPAALRRRPRRRRAVGGRRARPVVRRAARRGRGGHAGRAPVPRHHRGEPALRRAGGERRRAGGGAAPGPAGRPARRAAGRVGDHGGGARVPALGR